MFEIIFYTLQNQQLKWNDTIYLLKQGIPTGAKHSVPLANNLLTYGILQHFNSFICLGNLHETCPTDPLRTFFARTKIKAWFPPPPKVMGEGEHDCRDNQHQKKTTTMTTSIPRREDTWHNRDPRSVGLGIHF